MDSILGVNCAVKPNADSFNIDDFDINIEHWYFIINNIFALNVPKYWKKILSNTYGQLPIHHQ